MDVMILFLLLLLSVLRRSGLTKSSVDFGLRFIISSAGEVIVVVCGVILYVNRNLDNRVSRVPQVRRLVLLLQSIHPVPPYHSWKDDKVLML